jgi:hypothetical protein
MRQSNQEPDEVPGAAPGSDAPDAAAPAAVPATVPDPATVERESLLRHGFDPAAVVGRAAAGSLKGASPIPAAQQALLAAGALLEAHLADSEGTLARALQARLADAPALLDRHRERPAGALAELVDRLLAEPALLAGFVRETDARWGREYDERPRFEAADSPPAPDDPYTVDGVRDLLRALRRAL